MHPNPIYHTEGEASNLAFAAARGFGVLAVNGAEAPLLSHVPFLLEGGVADLHLVRSNPIVRALRDGPLPARIAVSGGDAYVSPDWYGIEDQVPTWNYVAVHLTGTLELRPETEMADLLARQSAAFEARLAPKAPWRMDKLSDAARERLMRAILPCRLSIASVDGTWKFGQNKPAAAREAVAAALDTHGFGLAPAAIAEGMRDTLRDA